LITQRLLCAVHGSLSLDCSMALALQSSGSTQRQQLCIHLYNLLITCVRVCSCQVLVL
jgi:hypothetical protein